MNASGAKDRAVGGAMRVGVDLVRVSRIAESLQQFGEQFLRRVFTAGEALGTAVARTA